MRLDLKNDMRLDLALRRNYNKFPTLSHIRNIESFHITKEYPDLHHNPDTPDTTTGKEDIPRLEQARREISVATRGTEPWAM
jgi:hypothetical protein